ncbi:MAG: hypothetical protein AAFW69_06645, partial [Pseudomonadota bacterium]
GGVELGKALPQQLVEEMVTLRAGALLGPGDPDQRVVFFAQNVGDHIAAATDNLLADAPRNLERSVFYNRLSAASVDALEAEARRAGGALLADLNGLAHELQGGDVAAGAGTERFRFGIFFYREDEAAAAGEDQNDGPRDDETR